jgi:hypothetical protein
MVQDLGSVYTGIWIRTQIRPCVQTAPCEQRNRSISRPFCSVEYWDLDLLRPSAHAYVELPGLQFIRFRVNIFRLVINPVPCRHVELDEFENGSEFIQPCVNVDLAVFS